MQWAIIPTGNVVAEITNVDPEGRFHPSWQCPSCDEAVRPRWTATEANGVWSFSPPVATPALQQPLIKAQLANLDTSIPRGMEDYWAATGFDTTKLPQSTQDKLAEKVALRGRLAALVKTGTP